MRLLLSLLLLSSAEAAEPEPRIEVRYADLNPSKQAELVESWKKHYRDSISGLPPVPKPVADKPVADKPVVTKPVADKPVAVAGPTITYAALRPRVESGETVLFAVGVPAPAGYVTLSDPPASITAGLWKGFHDGNDAVMRRVTTATADKGGAYQPRWTHPPDLRAHLISEMHGVPAKALDGLSLDELRALHDRLHDAASPRRATPAPAVAPTPQYRPAYQYPYQYQNPYQYQPYCPGGS